ncbi:MAG TPA: hypothetical protein PLO67_15800 [Saprospiraceae bacterium]|nr:hypothetical protein [Saprospiraceae bacterium]HPI07784.1 hypothetical protein [Saprospiraceae bacterium]
MRQILTIALLIAAGFFACHRDPEPEVSPRSVQRFALMIGYDVSQTYGHRTRPNEQFFYQAARMVAPTGGNICMGLVASPDSAGELIQAYFLPMPAEPEKNATYTKQITYRETCDSIRKHNEQEIERFVHECMARLNEKHDHRHSDLNGLLSEADIYFRGAEVSDCLHLLYLASDGLQDVRLEHRTDTILQPGLLTLRDVRVFCNGWKNGVLPENWKMLVSHESMIKEIHSLTQ